MLLVNRKKLSGRITQPTRKVQMSEHEVSHDRNIKNRDSKQSLTDLSVSLIVRRTTDHPIHGFPQSCCKGDDQGVINSIVITLIFQTTEKNY